MTQKTAGLSVKVMVCVFLQAIFVMVTSTVITVQMNGTVLVCLSIDLKIERLYSCQYCRFLIGYIVVETIGVVNLRVTF